MNEINHLTAGCGWSSHDNLQRRTVELHARPVLTRISTRHLFNKVRATDRSLLTSACIHIRTASAKPRNWGSWGASSMSHSPSSLKETISHSGYWVTNNYDSTNQVSRPGSCQENTRASAWHSYRSQEVRRNTHVNTKLSYLRSQCANQ